MEGSLINDPLKNLKEPLKEPFEDPLKDPLKERLEDPFLKDAL